MGRLATLARSRPGRAVSRRLDRNLAARRLALRLGVWEPRGADVPPETPVGIKLELTARCNLKCPFCYTDSPRQTQAKATSLGDDQWRAVVDDAVEAGIIEAVVTGGEPLLRSALTLELLDTLASSGVGTTLNTNGWFVDDTVADRLASVAGLQVNISVDGASPALHDGARGAAGSWERAIAGADRLLARGVRVRLIHVVTPANAAEVEHMLEHAWLLGAGSMRVTRVGLLGAASRGGDWDVPSSRLHAAVRRFRERRGEAMPVTVNTATAAGLAALEGVAPAALLVRPNGAVRIDSLSPFSFGSVREERLSDCWERVVSTWPHPAVVAWARSITTAEGIATSGHVPYRDEEVELAPGPGAVDGPAQVREDRIPSAVPQAPPLPGLEAARERVVELALARRYRHTPCRFTGSGRSGRYVRVAASGRTHRLNATAALVMDACDGGTPRDAVEALVDRHAAAGRAAVEADVLASVRSLLDRKIVEPAR